MNWDSLFTINAMSGYVRHKHYKRWHDIQLDYKEQNQCEWKAMNL